MRTAEQERMAAIKRRAKTHLPDQTLFLPPALFAMAKSDPQFERDIAGGHIREIGYISSTTPAQHEGASTDD